VNLYYSPVVRGLVGSTLVLGLRVAGVAKAYPLYLLRRPISDVVAGHALRIVPDQDALSAAVFEHGLAMPGDGRVWFAWHASYPRSFVYTPRQG
jgi:hypothetical protein